jgi:hypothetical protein
MVTVIAVIMIVGVMVVFMARMGVMGVRHHQILPFRWRRRYIL